MEIITDNKETCFNFFGNENVIAAKNFNSPIHIETIAQKLFKTQKLELYENDISSFWEYLFITGHSSESQFDIINKLISQNFELPKNLICLAETGERFHGFRNRKWKAEKGNIHLTLYFKPNQTNKNFHTGLLIVAAVAVLKTIDSIPSLDGKAKTKWVNDIVINNSKVCGIITQSFSSGSKINGAVVGLGLNVLTKPSIDGDIFTPESSSLLSHSNSIDCNLPNVLSRLLNNLSEGIELLNNGFYNSLLDIYVRRSSVINKEVSIYSDPFDGEVKKIVSGKVIDINNNLELILKNHLNPIKSGRLAIL